MYRHPFRFVVPGGLESVTSTTGTIASFLLVLVTLGYGALQFIDVVKYGKSSITNDTIDYYYDDTEMFNLDKTPGLNVAFGITYYDDNPDPIDDLDYGEVTGAIKSWGGAGGSTYTPLTLRPCTREELGLDSPTEI